MKLFNILISYFLQVKINVRRLYLNEYILVYDFFNYFVN